MRRYELVGQRDIRLNEHAEQPVPGPFEVRIEVAACTVCNRSDLAYFHYYGILDHCTAGCFGHEISGVVDAVGVGVTRVRPGQRVFVRTPLTSGYAELATAREIAVGQLPDAVPFEQGAMLQLLPLAVHATRGVRLGDRVIIVGQGPVGLMTLQVARHRGAAEIAVCDLDEWRLARAAELGADEAALVDGSQRELGQLGADFDVAIDAVGTSVTANACAGLVRHNGLIVLLGTHHVDTAVTFDLIQWERKGLRIHTAAEPTDAARLEALRVAERLAASDRLGIRTEVMLTHTYPLGELSSAMRLLSRSPLLYPASESSPFTRPPERTLKVAICP